MKTYRCEVPLEDSIARGKNFKEGAKVYFNGWNGPQNCYVIESEDQKIGLYTLSLVPVNLLDDKDPYGKNTDVIIFRRISELFTYQNCVLVEDIVKGN